MAKKKKGPAADALAALEALEMEEAAPSLEEEYPRPTKKAKKGRKGPAAAALAALEELEAEANGKFERWNVWTQDT